MDDDKTILPPDPREHRRQQKIVRQQHIKRTLRLLRDSDNLFLDDSITLAEDERTSLAKDDETDKKRMAINAAHTKRGTTSIGLAQRGRNAAYSLGSAFNRTMKKISKNKHVSIATHPIMVTYDSGANGHYISEKARRNAGLPILHPSTRKVGVANGGTSTAKYVTQLPFCTSNASRHIPGLPYVSDECRQDGRRWYCISLHKRGHQCIQRRRRAHHMQGQTHPHWRKR